MTIWVVHEDGKTELIALTGPISVLYGLNLDILQTGDGMEHWFTKSGYYDGWGLPMNGAGEDETTAIIERIEETRHVEECSERPEESH